MIENDFNVDDFEDRIRNDPSYAAVVLDDARLEVMLYDVLKEEKPRRRASRPIWRMSTMAASLLLFASVLWMILNPAPIQEDDSTPVKVQEKWTGTETDIRNEEFVRVDSHEAWMELWNRQGLRAKRPKVDFTKNMVVGVFLGSQKNYQGHALEFIRKDKTAITVRYSLDLGGAPSRATPYVLVMIEKSDRKVIIEDARGKKKAVLARVRVPADVDAMIRDVLGSGRTPPAQAELPKLTEQVREGVARELAANPKLKKWYGDLAAAGAPGRAGNWRLHGPAVKKLAEGKAVWCLASALCHQSYLVQLDAAKALGAIKDLRVAPFMLKVAKAMAIDIMGSKNATVHGFIQQGMTEGMNALTGADVGELKDGIKVWEEILKKK